MTTKARWAGLVGGVLMGGALTACGGGGEDGGPEGASAFTDQSGKEIADAALAATRGAESLRMDGTVTSSGEEVSIDLALDTAGDCAGTLSIGRQGEAEILSVGGAMFMKADNTFWESVAGGKEQAKAMISLIGDKWLKVPAEQDQFASFCDLDQLLADLEPAAGESAPDKGEVGAVDGAEAIELTTENRGETTSVWVATAEPHYVLQLQQTGGKEPGSVTLSEYNEDLALTEPKADEVLDLSTM